MSTTAVFLANGCEEMEAIITIDLLRRAEIDVTTVGINGSSVTGAHDIKFEADTTLDKIKEKYDAYLLPGGLPGAENLQNSKELISLLKEADQNYKIIGAICAAPGLVLGTHGFLKEKTATCYPSFEKNFEETTTFSEEAVVQDGNIITSRGPGTAFDFALKIISVLQSEEKSQSVAEAALISI